MGIFTPTVSFHHGPKEETFPNISKNTFFERKIRPTIVNSRKKRCEGRRQASHSHNRHACLQRVKTDAERERKEEREGRDQVLLEKRDRNYLLFSPPPRDFLFGETVMLCFFLLRKFLLRSSTSFPFKFQFGQGHTKKKQGKRPRSSHEV